ncbi:MAG: HAMP domain-containing histidine kinase [Propionibacteriaceae bacterium]|nr:HAMP domain-containing histidine kinase [Propionibacteriaceae bacterium]
MNRPDPPRPPPADDAARLKRASLSVGLYVAFATAIVFLVTAAVLIVFVVRRSFVTAPRWLPPGRDGVLIGTTGVRYTNTEGVIAVVVMLAVAGVVAMGVVGWLVSKRAVKPLADALTLQRHFVADASHELRTPLTVLHGRIQLLQRRLARGDDVAQTVAQLREDTETMNDVLNDLLLAVEGASPPGGEITAVVPAAREAARSLQVMADQAGVHLLVKAEAEPRVDVPTRSLIRAVVALADNAIQHAPAGSPVAVVVGAEPGWATVRVCDQGPGIPAEAAGQIFERFSHGTETGRKRSFGLGLALVSAIAQRFAGDINIESTGPDGTVFLLRFPSAVG